MNPKEIQRLIDEGNEHPAPDIQIELSLAEKRAAEELEAELRRDYPAPGLAFGINADGTQMSQEEADAYARLHPQPRHDMLSFEGALPNLLTHLDQEITTELVSTIGFNVFVHDKLEDGREIQYAIPYENIALARSVFGGDNVRRVEVYMIEQAVYSMFRMEGHDADRFWKWYTE